MNKNRTLEEIIEQYDDANLMNILNEIQESQGFLSKKILQDVSKKLKIPLAKLYSTVSFYAFFRLIDGKKHVLQVCNCLSCYLKGTEEILKKIEEKRGIKPGESDDKIAIEVVQCIGCCDKAPALLLDGEPKEELTKEKVMEILEQCES